MPVSIGFLAFASILLRNQVVNAVSADCSAENSVPWDHAGPATYNDFTEYANMTSAGAIQAAVRAGGNTYPARWLVGSANGGVWSTPASGLKAAKPKWTAAFDGQPVNCYSISVVAVSQYDPDVVFAGCGGSTSSEQGSDWNVVNDGDWGGVMVSTDAGATWAMTSFPAGYYITGIVAINPDTMIVSTRSHVDDPNNGGVWAGVSNSNNKISWALTLPHPAFGITYAPSEGGKGLLIAALALETRTVFASDDQGNTWADWSDGISWPSNHLPFYPCLAIAHNTAYLGGLTVNQSDPTSTATLIFTRTLPSSKPDATWMPLPNQRKMDDDAMPKDRMALLPSPTDPSILYVAGNGEHIAFRVTLPEGNWTSLTREDTMDNSAPHCDCRSLSFNPDLNELVLTSDGGVFARSAPSAPGGQWRSLNGDIGGMEMLSAQWDATLDRWIAGAQDNDVQLAPPGTTGDSMSYGVVMGDGTVTAVDNTVMPARLFGARQCLGGGPADNGIGDDNDAGLVFVEGDSPRLRVGIDLGDLGFEDPQCFPYFNQPYGLNTQAPTNLVFWANCSVRASEGATSGWYELTIPHGTNSSTQLKPPTFLAPTEGEVYSFVAGGFTSGQSDSSVLVGMNGTHMFYRSAVTNGAVTLRPLPTTFAPPVVFDIRNGESVVGPVSHDKTVSIAISPRNSKVVAVTGWPSVRSNEGAESVWVTSDAGETWTNATGNLADGVQRARASGLLIIDFDGKVNVSAILVGTTAGALISWSDALGKWSRLGSCAELPLIMVKGLSYEHFSDTLLAATMGRGVYVLRKAKEVLLGMRPDLAKKGVYADSSEQYFAPRDEA